nr:hypothetical protein [Tanacetum cinerariifolium]
DFSKVDAKPLTNKEDKVFNPGILIQEKPFEIITRVFQDKKMATSNASLVLEDFDPPFYEPLFFKEVPSIRRNLKTHAEGFCPPVFISSASLGNYVSKSNRANEIYSNPLLDEEIISIKIDLHHFNAESDLIESLLNHDSSIISSSLKIDSLFDEFATAFESFSPSPIPVEDSDSLMEEIDLSFTSDDPMPTGIEEDDYDSERYILILEELLSNDSLSFPENESFHFDIPSSFRPPAKPPDGNTGI